MPSIFTSIPKTRLKRYKYNLGNINNLTTDFGILTPVYSKLFYPGDSIRGNANIFCEFMPMLAPIRAEIDIFVHHFVVPLRLIWDDFEDFITGGAKGDAKPILPQFNLSQMYLGNRSLPGSLYDYLGFPTRLDTDNYSPSDIKPYYVSALKFRAYQQIFNDYYIDLNLTDPIEFSTSSGIVSSNDMRVLEQLRYRAWRKDYFTSALPFAQRGGAVQIQGPDMLVQLQSALGDPLFVDSLGRPVKSEDIKTNESGFVINSEGSPVYFDPNGSLGVGSQSMFTVDQLRQYLAVQRQLEIDARGGSRYIENILANFGVLGDDARLQRAQYIGGGKQPVMVQAVVQTSASDDQTGQNLGEKAGNAISSGSDNFFSHFFKEHCIFMSIMSILPKSHYFQGVEREDTFKDRFEFYWPTFQHLGEQPIKNSELFFNPTTSDNDDEFGYTPRYSELKWKANEIHGQFRTSLLYYHTARAFANRPVLNDNFIRMTPEDVSRVFAVTDTSSVANHLLITVKNNVSALRPIMRSAIPKII